MSDPNSTEVHSVNTNLSTLNAIKEAHRIKKQVLIKPMKARDKNEVHRASTPLELLYDLVFVVAIAFAGVQLHHAITENHIAQGVVSYGIVFFAIWWAWMGFTWFASAFDTDDVLYRFAVLIQMGGALIIAVGIEPVFLHNDFKIMIVGFVIMRVGLIFQWLRAGYSDPQYRGASIRQAFGLSIVQLGWISLLFLPAKIATYLPILLIMCELSVPYFAEKHTPTPWHAGHISERYGLLTLIVIGESILATVQAIRVVITNGDFNSDLIQLIIGALLTLFIMWWVYFDRDVEHQLKNSDQAFSWSYGHYFIFASIAAYGAGLAANIDFMIHKSHISHLTASYALAIPVAVYFFSLWIIYDKGSYARRTGYIFPVACTLILLTPLVPYTASAIGLVLLCILLLKFNFYDFFWTYDEKPEQISLEKKES